MTVSRPQRGSTDGSRRAPQLILDQEDRFDFGGESGGPDRVTTEDGGPILEATRPRRFVFQWSPDNPSYTTTVEIDLEPVHDGTIVRLKESGYHHTASGRKAMLRCSAGWGEALTLWKFYVEHGLRY